MITLPSYQKEVVLAWTDYISHVYTKYSFLRYAGQGLNQDQLIKGFEDLYSCKIAYNDKDMRTQFKLIFEDEKYATVFLLKWL
jgi:hypothetical protein